VDREEILYGVVTATWSLWGKALGGFSMRWTIEKRSTHQTNAVPLDNRDEKKENKAPHPAKNLEGTFFEVERRKLPLTGEKCLSVSIEPNRRREGYPAAFTFLESDHRGGSFDYPDRRWESSLFKSGDKNPVKPGGRLFSKRLRN